MIRVLILNVLIGAALWAAESTDPFDDKTFTPSVTGLVITQFVPESQVKKFGLRIGDIITSYAGKPLAGHTDLVNAVQANTTDAVIIAQRGQETVTITAKPGKLGVYSTFVEGGKALSLPPDTAVMFSLERLKKSPLDTWYHFIIDGKKVGAEHARLELVGNNLTITIEVLFDGGERWGLNHMIETGVLDVSGPAPRVVTLVHEGPLTGFRSAGRWKDATTWELTVDAKNEDGSPLHEVSTGTPTGPLINDYSFSSLPALMPTTPGACHHTRTVMLLNAQPTGWSALVVAGTEDTQIGEEHLHLVRMEQRSLRGTGWVAWVMDGEVLKHDYSGGQGSTIAYKTTKEKALEGLDAKLVPRTTK